MRSVPARPSAAARTAASAAGCLGEHAPRVRQERLPDRRQRDAPARAVEELRADLVLEGADLLAQRRLRDEDARGGAAEVELVGDGDKVAKVSEFHRRRDRSRLSV